MVSHYSAFVLLSQQSQLFLLENPTLVAKARGDSPSPKAFGSQNLQPLANSIIENKTTTIVL